MQATCCQGKVFSLPTPQHYLCSKYSRGREFTTQYGHTVSFIFNRHYGKEKWEENKMLTVTVRFNFRIK